MGSSASSFKSAEVRYMCATAQLTPSGQLQEGVVPPRAKIRRSGARAATLVGGDQSGGALFAAHFHEFSLIRWALLLS